MAAPIWVVAALAVPATAHSALIGTSLKDHPVKAQKPTAVTIRFNSGVEVSLSQVLLVNSKGKESRLKITPGKKPNEVIVQIPALAPGTYGLRYKMLATDGHLTDELLRFPVTGSQ